MKKLLLIVSLFLSAYSFAQEPKKVFHPQVGWTTNLDSALKAQNQQPYINNQQPYTSSSIDLIVLNSGKEIKRFNILANDFKNIYIGINDITYKVPHDSINRSLSRISMASGNIATPGGHLIKSANDQGAAIIVSVVGIGLGGAIFAITKQPASFVIPAISSIVSIGLNISSISHKRKAGIKMEAIELR